ncbi:YaiI/YqxD family protein [Fusibacter bizertensis]
MRIWIDGDGCPVILITTEIAKRHNLDVFIVKNHTIKIENDYAKVITVDLGRDAADYYIVNHMTCGDLVVTQDYGLAAMAIAKEGAVITHSGNQITTKNIDFVLENRHQGKLDRQRGSRGPRHKKRTLADDETYSKLLELLIIKDQQEDKCF